jgi:hypothetical protein
MAVGILEETPDLGILLQEVAAKHGLDALA